MITCKRILTTVITLFMIISVVILWMNVTSLKLQRIVKQEMMTGTLSTRSDVFLQGFPALPDISVEGEPIAVSKSRYLIAEAKYREALALLKRDRSSPYDTRQEFFMGYIYLNLRMYDSALFYSKKVFREKPLFASNVHALSQAYVSLGDITSAMKVLKEHVKLIRENGLPVQAEIASQMDQLNIAIKVAPHKELYSQALSAFGDKDYMQAVRLFTDLIDHVPGLATAFEYRAFCYFYLNDYEQSLLDIERAIGLDSAKSGYFNLRGLNNQLLGNDLAGCQDFKRAIRMGDRDAPVNYQRFCEGKEKQPYTR